MPGNDSNTWGTPPPICEWLAATYGRPDLDVAADEAGLLAKAPRWFHVGCDALAPGRSWACEVGFGNPPYSRDLLGPFVARARTAIDSGEARRCFQLVIPYTPAVGWWAAHVRRTSARHIGQAPVQVAGRVAYRDSYADGRLRVDVYLLGRVRFVPLPGVTLQRAEKAGSGRADSAAVVFYRPELFRIMPGGDLATLRARLNYTQAGLADVLGVTQGAVSKWERGACPPDVLTRAAALPPAAPALRGPYRRGSPAEAEGRHRLPPPASDGPEAAE